MKIRLTLADTGTVTVFSTFLLITCLLGTVLSMWVTCFLFGSLFAAAYEKDLDAPITKWNRFGRLWILLTIAIAITTPITMWFNPFTNVLGVGRGLILTFILSAGAAIFGGIGVEILRDCFRFFKSLFSKRINLVC